MTRAEEKEIAKRWYRQGVMDTVKDVNPEGIDNDFEMLYGHQFAEETCKHEYGTGWRCIHCEGGTPREGQIVRSQKK